MDRDQVQAAITAVAEERNALIGQIGRLAHRTELLEQVLTTFEPAPAPVIELQLVGDDIASAVEQEPAKREPAKRAPQKRAQCPHSGCGFESTPAGMSMHIKHKHPAQVPAAAKAPAPTRNHDVPAKPKVHRCDDCGLELAVGHLDQLAAHTDRVHRRRLLQVERMLVEAEAA